MEGRLMVLKQVPVKSKEECEIEKLVLDFIENLDEILGCCWLFIWFTDEDGN
jgi:hypothetical protein